MSTVFRTYKRRWIYLLATCLVNFSNGNTWITYSSITFYTNEFYDNTNAALFFNVIFLALSIPVGLLACWWTDRFGLRSAYHIGAWANFIGNVIRFAGSGEWVSKNMRFPLSFTGQIVAAFAQPFVMFLPTKLAANWFPQDQRAIANTLSSMSNPVGIAVMYSVAPLIVNGSHPAAFPLLTGVCATLATLTIFITLFITRSKPPTPVAPSRDSEIKIPPFLDGVKLCMRNKTYLVLAVCLGEYFLIVISHISQHFVEGGFFSLISLILFQCKNSHKSL
uniref:MFS domain-containing protein n=1 Tax=Angiostrongylus cantonensis TaxID=6313 RepID=A0A0K0D3R5_ANGCA